MAGTGDRTEGRSGRELTIGEWRVQPDLGRATRDDRLVHLEPRVMDVLVCLAERAGEVVSREEIIDVVWATEFIAANTLTHAIAEIRHALCDDARTPSYIQTIPKRGYRLIARVEFDDPRPRASNARRYGLALMVDDRSTPLVNGEYLIGRTDEADIRVDTPEVSRRHAVLVVRRGTVSVEDLGSKNGTFLDGRPVTGREVVRPGAIIRLGRHTARIRVVGAETDTETDWSLSGERQRLEERTPTERDRRRRSVPRSWPLDEDYRDG
jgi:DNA-binding winged helix-turn-helix (wHTH) protein